MKQPSSGYGCSVVIILIFIGLVAGFILGSIYSNYVAHSIAQSVRNTNPNDPLDMLPFVSFGYTAIGAMLGALIGAILGIILYLKDKSQTENNEEG